MWLQLLFCNLFILHLIITEESDTKDVSGDTVQLLQ